MTGRQQIEAALSVEGTDRIPAVICYEDIFIRDHWDELTEHPWWFRFSPDLAHQMAWRRDAIEAIGQDWFYLPACGPRAEREATSIQQGPSDVLLVDRRTGRQRRLERPEVGGWESRNKAAYTQRPALADTAEKVDAAVQPAGPFDPARFAAEGRADLARMLLAEFGRHRFPLCHATSPLWNCYGLWGFEGMMQMVAERPGLVEHACRRFLAHRLRSVREAAALGAAGIWIEECLTDLVSPEAFARLNVPSVRRLVEEIRSLGMRSVYYYCGDPARRWDHIFSIGADAVALEESKKDFTIDIEDIVRRAGGGCSVLGNLDAIHLLPAAPKDELRDEIARQIDAGRRNRGRFIMSIGSPVTPGTPLDRVRLYCDLVHQLG
jgi:hypothetical protein